jgi:hypothetical protein
VQRVVKRPPEQRRKLPPHLEAFARSDEEKLRIRRPRTDRGHVKDPREGYTVAGVSNRDARAVYDVRARAMRELWNDGAADERAIHTLGQLLLDALRLELWEARRLTSFAAFAEEVIGIQASRAEALAEAASARTGEPATPLTERAIALWLRTEAGLYEGDEGARARIRSGEDGAVLEISVSLEASSTALAGVGARHLPLARARDEQPRREREEAPRPPRFEEPEEEELPVEPPHLEREDDVEDSEEDLEEGFTELAEEAGIVEDDDDDDDDELDVAPSEPAPSPVAGGVKLLTRKHAANEPRFQERPREDRTREERPREERPRFPGNDRPRFQGSDRPRFQGNDRPRFNDREERPRFGGAERTQFGSHERDRPHAQGNDRPRFQSNDRGGRGPVDRSQGKPNFRKPGGAQGGGRFGGNKFGGQGGGKFGGQGGGKFGGQGGGKFGGQGGGKFGGQGGGKFGGQGGGGKFGGQGGGKFGGAAKPGKQGQGFGARQSFGDKPQTNRRRDDDFDE